MRIDVRGLGYETTRLFCYVALYSNCWWASVLKIGIGSDLTGKEGEASVKEPASFTAQPMMFLQDSAGTKKQGIPSSS